MIRTIYPVWTSMVIDTIEEAIVNHGFNEILDRLLKTQRAKLQTLDNFVSGVAARISAEDMIEYAVRVKNTMDGLDRTETKRAAGILERPEAIGSLAAYDTVIREIEDFAVRLGYPPNRRATA